MKLGPRTKVKVYLTAINYCMRDNHIVLSDDELNRLSNYREKKFGSDSVPFGETVSKLLEEVEDE